VYEISAGQPVVGEIPPRKREDGGGNNGGRLVLAPYVRGVGNDGEQVRMWMRMRARCICVMWCPLVVRDVRGCRFQLNPRTWPSKISGWE